MKKIMNVIAVLILVVLLLPVCVRADVIYQPFDMFYEAHWEECEYVCRSFTANGPNGDVTLYQDPQSETVTGTVTNGAKMYVSYTYEDSRGIVWGCCEIWEEDLLGWAPMDYLELVYDGISFEEEYGHEFLEEEGSVAENFRGKKIYFWQYPGSSEYVEIELDDSGEYLPEYSTVYVDELGNTWARCGYYMGIKGHWLYLNDPTADYDTLFPGEIPETEPAPTELRTERVEEIAPMEDPTLKIVLTTAVIAVMALTALLLIMYKLKM